MKRAIWKKQLGVQDRKTLLYGIVTKVGKRIVCVEYPNAHGFMSLTAEYPRARALQHLRIVGRNDWEDYRKDVRRNYVTEEGEGNGQQGQAVQRVPEKACNKQDELCLSGL